MTKQNKNIVLLLIGVILLFSFTKAPKRKGSIIVEPLQGNNLYANKLAQLYDGLDPSLLYYTFNGGELLTLIEDTGIDYKVSYVKPGGETVTGYIRYEDITIK
jgi:hypothetical protein